MEEGWRVELPPPHRTATSETPGNLKTLECHRVRTCDQMWAGQHDMNWALLRSNMEDG